jgi:hypothetical protein
LFAFTWLDQKADQGDEDDEDKDKDNKDNDAPNDGNLSYEDFTCIKPVKDETRYTTPPTIWIGV